MNEIKNDNNRVPEGVVEEIIDQDLAGQSDSSFEEMSFPPRPTFGYSLNSSQLRRRAPMVEKMNLNELPKTSSTTFNKQQSSQPSTSEQKSNASNSSGADKNASEDSSQAEFTCNICFDAASGPVVTLCGHLYCWSCLHRWLQSHRRAQLCPVCKAGCSKEQVIPIYGRGKEAKDPRLNEDIPQRPQAQRPAPQPTNPFDPASFFFNNPFNNQNNNNVFQFHFFPGFIPSLFAFNFAQTQDNNQGTAQQAFLNRLFFMIGLLILTCILLL